MDGSESDLDKFDIAFTSFLESACDARKRIDHLFLSLFLEIGIGFNRENIGLREFELPYVSCFLRDIVSNGVDLDIGIVSIDLILEELRIFAIDHEKESNNPICIGYLEAKFWSRIGFVEKILVFLKGVVEDIQDLFRHKNPLFIEAIDSDFEDSFMCAQFFWE